MTKGTKSLGSGTANLLLSMARIADNQKFFELTFFQAFVSKKGNFNIFYVNGWFSSKFICRIAS
jgi:hypothetical protein